MDIRPNEGKTGSEHFNASKSETFARGRQYSNIRTLTDLRNIRTTPQEPNVHTVLSSKLLDALFSVSSVDVVTTDDKYRMGYWFSRKSLNNYALVFTSGNLTNSQNNKVIRLQIQRSPIHISFYLNAMKLININSDARNIPNVITMHLQRISVILVVDRNHDIAPARHQIFNGIETRPCLAACSIMKIETVGGVSDFRLTFFTAFPEDRSTKSARYWRVAMNEIEGFRGGKLL